MGDANQLPRLGRRGFLAGVAGGLTAGAAAGYSTWQHAPEGWHTDRLPQGTKLSFAQNGEDLILESLLGLLKLDKPTYLDVGAFHPTVGSNTYLFYRAGGRGVLVEPNPDLAPHLRGVRPGDVLLTAGIGIDATPAADYYRMSVPQNNTFDKEQAERLDRDPGANCKIEQVVKMPLLNVNAVIAEHFGGKPPDLFSIDVEGLDLAILKTLDFARFRPPVFCVEHSQESKERAELLAFLGGHGYTVRGLTYPNSIFVDTKRM
ncbi:MAG: FkbM family methyltransferase [Gemmataceae bacterium]